MPVKGMYVRYIGDGVRDVPKVGKFQKDTVAFVPRDLALELLREPCFVFDSGPMPVVQMIIRTGQYQDPNAGLPPGPLPEVPGPDEDVPEYARDDRKAEEGEEPPSPPKTSTQS